MAYFAIIVSPIKKACIVYYEVLLLHFHTQKVQWWAIKLAFVIMTKMKTNHAPLHFLYFAQSHFTVATSICLRWCWSQNAISVGGFKYKIDIFIKQNKLVKYKTITVITLKHKTTRDVSMICCVSNCLNINVLYSFSADKGEIMRSTVVFCINSWLFC